MFSQPTNFERPKPIYFCLKYSVNNNFFFFFKWLFSMFVCNLKNGLKNIFQHLVHMKNHQIFFIFSHILMSYEEERKGRDTEEMYENKNSLNSIRSELEIQCNYLLFFLTCLLPAIRAYNCKKTHVKPTCPNRCQDRQPETCLDNHTHKRPYHNCMS